MDHLTPTQCKMARTGLGLTVEQLALFAKTSPTTISNYERGHGSFTDTTRKKIMSSLKKLGIIYDIELMSSKTKGLHVFCQGIMISYDYLFISKIYYNIIKRGYCLYDQNQDSEQLFFPYHSGRAIELSNLIIAHSNCDPNFEYKDSKKLSLYSKQFHYDQPIEGLVLYGAAVNIFYDHEHINNERLETIFEEYLAFIHAEHHDSDLFG